MVRTARIVLMTLACIAGWAAAGPAQAAATVRLCGTVVFTPQSEDGAFQIRAKGVGCKTARAVARAARGRGPEGQVGRKYFYRARGFACNGTEFEDGLPSVKYRCKRGTSTVNFTKG